MFTGGTFFIDERCSELENVSRNILIWFEKAGVSQKGYQ